MTLAMTSVWKDEYKVHSYEVDVKGNATVPILCQFMQESAWNHAEHLGVGFSHLMEKNLIWVLSRQLVKINSFPKWGETIKIYTWPTAKDRLFCYRDFRILDKYDSVIAIATTAWFAIDLLNRKPQSPDSYFQIELNDPVRVLPEKLNKIKSLTTQKRTKLVRVGYKDLDVNEHVNNVRFVEWILDSFSLNFQKAHNLQEIEINYLSEAFYNDEISVSYEGVGNLTFLHSLYTTNNNTELCRVRTLWGLTNRANDANLNSI